jgi:chorismate mutase
MKKELKIEPIKIRNKIIDRPIIIAGPCSAETEEQTLQTAHQIKDMGVDVFRAGIWKPRTRPGMFEGTKTEGLPWMKRVKEETGMAIGTEVASAMHVYEVLKYGFDVLWIGARTTANPFAVQEIADALRGVDIPVLVKNPVNIDLNLWVGAIERINRAGVKQVAAIHRGFSTYNQVKYRNEPHWQIPLELKRRIPEIQIINDPSHMGGRHELIHEISQQAMNLNFDGLMIEAHIDPANAWSDARQQVTPKGLSNILKDLVIREFVEANSQIDLVNLRAQIDQIDQDVLDILGKRMQIAEEIGKYKKDNNMTIFQPGRYNDIMEVRVKQGESKGLTTGFTERVFKSIHEESILHQEALMKEKP